MKSVAYLKGLLLEKTKKYPDHLKLRSLSWPVLGLICDTPITANQVTLLSLGLGIFGSILIIFLPGLFRLFGVLLMYIGIILDFVDGTLARYKNTKSTGGMFLDSLGHSFVPAIMLVCIGFAAGQPLIGALGGVVFLMTKDFLYKQSLMAKFSEKKIDEINQESKLAWAIGSPMKFIVELTFVFILINHLFILTWFYLIFLSIRAMGVAYIAFRSLEGVKEAEDVVK